MLSIGSSIPRAVCTTAILAALLCLQQALADQPLPFALEGLPATPQTPAHKALRATLADLPHRIVYESFRNGNWELVAIEADGSAPVNLTRTPNRHELYPHCSPDGTKIAFMADESGNRGRQRNVYYMNADGTGLTLVAQQAGQPCWRPDGKAITYLPLEFGRYSQVESASDGLYQYEPDTRRWYPHSNRTLQHLYAICWTPDRKWILATIRGALEYADANLAIEADGNRIFNLEALAGCRPDITPDGRQITWTASDHEIVVADLNLQTTPPAVTNIRRVVTCPATHKVYHPDWSPDGRYIVFSGGPTAGSQAPGMMARGWHIYVADPQTPNLYVPVTRDGLSNKEPDWLPAGAGFEPPSATGSTASGPRSESPAGRTGGTN